MKGEYPPLDRLSAVPDWRYTPRSSTMASSGSGDQSNSLSSTSGRATARFGVGSLEGDDAFATPSLVIAVTGECIPLTDGDAVDGSDFAANSYILRMP